MTVESESSRVQSATVVVQYGACSLVPAPFIDHTVQSNFDDQGVRQSNTTRIVLTGSVVVLPSGSFEQMYVKQEELRTAFSTDDLPFTIVAGPGNRTLADGIVICSGLTPKVLSVNIAPDIHVTRFDYTIEMEDVSAASGISGVVDSFSNQWQFSENDSSCTLDVTHVVSAQGLDGESDAFEQAVVKVKANLGIDKLPLQLPCFAQPNFSGLFNATHPSDTTIGGPVFEVSVQRQEVADVANGNYSITEVFTIVSGVPFFFAARNESYVEDENGIATVTLQGTVQGLGRTLSPSFGSIGGVGFDRACSGFLNQIEPQLPNDASGVYLKYKTTLAATTSGLAVTNPISRTISQNKCRGTLDFTISYTDDPKFFLPSGIASRTCSINRQDAIRLFAAHPIPFRNLGPLVQDIKTTTEGNVSITCSATAKNTGDPIADTNRAIIFVQNELNRLRAVHADPGSFIDLRIASKQQQNSDIELSSSATVVYAFTNDLASTQNVNSDITLETL